MKYRGHIVAGRRTSRIWHHAAESFAVTLLFGVCMHLTGCSEIEKSPSPAAVAISGYVRGGQQPITGSLVQLYAVGTTGDKSAATSLIATSVTTSDGTGALNANANAGNANNSLPAGSFGIIRGYTCPSPSAPVYLVATGGNPGLASGSKNPQIALMAVLGPCGNLTPSTIIAVNELTTVASIAPVVSFIGSYSTLGSGVGDASQFITSLNQVTQYTDTTLGTVPGPSLPSGSYASSYEIRTLGDILASCVNSNGGVAGDATACGKLFQFATPPGGLAPTDTIQTVIDILANPTSNVDSLYGLRVAAAPFQPALPSAPASWNLPITLLPTTFSPSLNNTSVFIGASIINYWPMPLHNTGVPGDTSAQVLARFSSDALNHGYSRVIILCGTNDILQNTPNLTTEMTANLQAMAVMANKAGMEVVLKELPPLTSNGS